MPSEPRPPEGYETWLDYALDVAPTFTPHGEYRVKRARAELATLRDDSRRWQRLRKRFFDKFGVPDSEREYTPIDDSVLHRFLFDAWADAEKWRKHMADEQSDNPNYQ